MDSTLRIACAALLLLAGLARSAESEPEQPDRPHPATDVRPGAWAEWTVHVDPEQIDRPPVPLAAGDRADAFTLAVRLTAQGEGDTATHLRVQVRTLASGSSRPTRREADEAVTFALADLLGHLPDADEAKAPATRTRERVRVGDGTLETVKTIYAPGGKAPDDAPQRAWQCWRAEAVDLGPVRLRGPGLRADLVDFGASEAPPFPLPEAQDGTRPRGTRD